MVSYNSIQCVLRQELYDIFDKLSDSDLIRMYNILNELDLIGFNMSFCIEILENRGYVIDKLPKHLKSIG